MSDHTYKLTYRVQKHPEGLTRPEVMKLDQDGDLGACDALLLASIIYPADGSLSIMFIGQDGRTNAELEDLEWFKVWTLLSARLARSETLSDEKRALCEIVMDVIRQSVLGKEPT